MVLATNVSAAAELAQSGHLVDNQVMAFTHQQGITHGDIKPENVLLQDNGNIALCDFGISKDIISGAYESTMNLSAAGTLAYCAPEAGNLQLFQSCNPGYTSCLQMHLYAYT